MKQVKVGIPRRQGPFSLEKLRIADLDTFVNKTQTAGLGSQMLTLLTLTLVDKKGKRVFDDEEQAEAALGAASILDLGMQSFEYSELNKLADISKRLEAAQKN